LTAAKVAHLAQLRSSSTASVTPASAHVAPTPAHSCNHHEDLFTDDQRETSVGPGSDVESLNNNDFNEDRNAPHARDDDEISDRSVSPEIGNKRSRSPTEDISEQPMQKAYKITASRGRTKAGDFDPATQALLKVVIACYCGRLCNENPYPDPMLALTWAKLAWNEACHLCDSHIRYTTELLKLICLYSSHYFCFIYVYYYVGH
jgi:hypothetical protein